MAQTIINVKKDRLRYTKNKFSSTLMYLAILFGVLYFVSIYESDVNNYYYTYIICISVLCNLVFLLTAFLCSEGLKNYKMSYSYVSIVLGAFQLIRILGIPKNAHSTLTVVDGIEVPVMGEMQFTFVTLMLVLSAFCCFAAGVIGIYKSVTLTRYIKENGLE